jgi:hypothetical protein
MLPVHETEVIPRERVRNSCDSWLVGPGRKKQGLKAVDWFGTSALGLEIGEN